MKENEVLARFMGGKFEECDVITVGGRRTGKWTFDDDRWCYDDQLDYNTDWRRLMPVWYKFRDLKFEDAGCHLNYKIQIVNAIVNKGPEEACKRLSEAIEWYNANKQL